MERMVEKQCACCKVVKPTENNFAWLKTRFCSWCRDCKKIKKKEWDLKNQDRVKENAKEFYKTYYPKNKEKIFQRTIEWQRNNKEKYAIKSKRWYENNKHKSFAHSAKYRAAKRNACPSWLDETMKLEIEAIYSKANKISIETGVAHEVDHIVPLCGETVCGLHVPWNLQVLSQFDNRSKRNNLE
jgi:hypothetical protein